MAVRQSASRPRARSVEVPVMSLCAQRAGPADAVGDGWEGTWSSARGADGAEDRAPAQDGAVRLGRSPAVSRARSVPGGGAGFFWMRRGLPGSGHRLWRPRAAGPADLRRGGCGYRRSRGRPRKPGTRPSRNEHGAN